MIDWTGKIPLQRFMRRRRVVVRRIRFPRERIVLAAHLRRRHPLLLLPPVAKPHAHHLLVQLQRVGETRDLLGRRLRRLVKVLLQRPLHRHLDTRPLFALAALRRNLVNVGRRAGGAVRLGQPFLQQRLQLAHVFKAKLQRLEPADGGLAEHVAVQGAEGEADVGLREAELYPPLFELLGESLEVI